jgi:hypothetical protein
MYMHPIRYFFTDEVALRRNSDDKMILWQNDKGDLS